MRLSSTCSKGKVSENHLQLQTPFTRRRRQDETGCLVTDGIHGIDAVDGQEALRRHRLLYAVENAADMRCYRQADACRSPGSLLLREWFISQGA